MDKNQKQNEPLLIKDALKLIRSTKKKLHAYENASCSPIAIIGMACRFPGANNLDEYWSLLQTGEHKISELPSNRFNSIVAEKINALSPTGRFFGGFVEEIESFDAAFFNINAHEMMDLDPQQRLLLEVSWQALENANITAAELATNNTGVYIGIGSNEYSSRCNNDLESVGTYLASGNAQSVAAGRLAHFYNVTGPCMAIDTACSSSLVAMHTAIQDLRHAECRTALVGGVNLLFSPHLFMNFANAKMLAADGLCKVFDDAADGYVRAEGCGFVILKLLSDAIADNNNVLAVIKGSAINHDGRSSGLTVPNGSAQKSVIKSALKNANVSAEQISYIEAHGTGTALGDPIELTSLGEVFFNDRKSIAPSIGSVKTNIGHLESAAGIAGLIKVVLMLQHKLIPKHLNYLTPNTRFDWQKYPFNIPATLTAWETSQTTRLAGISAFGFSGTNAHLILEESGVSSPQKQQASTTMASQILTISAKNPQSLQSLLRHYADFISNSETRAISEITALSNIGRMHFNFRQAIVSANKLELVAKLHALSQQPQQKRYLSKPKLFFVFSDYSSINDMRSIDLTEIHASFSISLTQFKDLFYSTFIAIANTTNIPVNSVDKYWARHEVKHCAAQYSLFIFWQQLNVLPEAILGYGIGAYIGAAAANIITIADAMKLLIYHLVITETKQSNTLYHTQLLEKFIDDIKNLTKLKPNVNFVTDATVAAIKQTHPTDKFWIDNLSSANNFWNCYQHCCENNNAIMLDISLYSEFCCQATRKSSPTNAYVISSLLKNKCPRQSIQETIADLYMADYAINWDAFTRLNHSTAIQLPNYSFAKFDYPIHSVPISNLTYLRKCDSTSLIDNALFLSNRLTVFESTISLQKYTYLQDHIICGHITFPSTMYLELILQAAQHIFKCNKLTIADLSLEKMLLIPPDKTKLLHINLVNLDNENTAEVTIYSYEINKSGKSNWVKHAGATVAAINNDATTASAKQFDKLKISCKSPLEPKIFYANCQDSGINFGPSFRCITALTTKENAALAKIQTHDNQAKNYICFPPLLDACLQGLGITGMHHDSFYMPIYIKSLTIYQNLPTTGYAYTEKITDEKGAVTVYTETGEPVITIEGLKLKKIRPDSFAQLNTVANDTKDYCYIQKWLPTKACKSHESSTSDTSKHWVIIIEKNQLSEILLSKLLQNNNQGCIFTPEELQLSHSNQKLADMLQHKYPPYGTFNIVLAIDFTKPNLNCSPISACHDNAAKTLHMLQNLITLKQLKPNIRLNLWLITRGTQIATAESSYNLAQSVIWGIGRSAQTETPELNCKLIDIDPALAAAHAIDKLTTELLQASTHQQCAITADLRLSPQLVKISLATRPNSIPICRADATYLIIGGLSGLGLKTAAHLAKINAKNLCLVGKRNFSDTAKKVISKLRSQGVNVNVKLLDISSRDNVIGLLADIKTSMPPLKGVFQCAIVLDDAILANQTTTKYHSVFAPKIVGTWHLHELTTKLQLDYFVLFSAGASILGNPGQSNYVAASCFLDTLTRFRTQNKLPILCINWGAWSEVGRAKNLSMQYKNIGLKYISPASGLMILEALLHNSKSQTATSHVAAINIDWQQYTSYLGAIPEWLNTIALSENIIGTNANKLEQTDNAKSDTSHSIKKLVKTLIIETLGIKYFNPELSFYDYGMDSLIAANLYSKLQLQMPDHIKLSATVFIDHNNLDKITSHLTTLLANKSDNKISVSKQAMNHSDAEHIAIIGMACRFPGSANNVDAYWELLKSETDAITELPMSRWSFIENSNACKNTADKQYYSQGGFISDIENFDADFFNISPREARSTDPQQRILLELCWEMFESAAISTKDLRNNKVGVFIGACNQDYATLIANANLINQYTGTGSGSSAIAGRLSHFFNLTGPSMVINTACSSSLVSVHMACQSLKTYESNMAIAGGINAILLADVSLIEKYAGMLSAIHRCQAFSESADGFVRGEGGGVVLLKRLSDALADADNILAIIPGSAVNQDGDSGNLTIPNGDAQQHVINAALANANIPAEQVSYIEAHGTGTALGDPIEINALSAAYTSRDKHSVYVGSVKSNIGHLESAAGIAGLIKTVLAIQHRQLPASLHCNNLNSRVPWHDNAVKVVTKLTPWSSTHGPLTAGVSSFGFTGTNAHVLLTEPPPIVASNLLSPEIKRPCIFILTAQTPSALNELTTHYTNYINSHKELSLADLCYTLNTKRKHLRYRIALVCHDITELQSKLSAKKYLTSPSELTLHNELTFAFNGFQAKQYIYAKHLCATEPVYRKELANCRQQIIELTGKDIFEHIYAEPNTDPATGYLTNLISLALGYALFHLIESLGLAIEYISGIDIGKITCLVITESISLESAITMLANNNESLLFSQYNTVANNNSNTKTCYQITAVSQTKHNEIPIDFQSSVEELLAQLVVNGAKIDWNKYYKSSHNRIFNLPTYTFQRQYHWLKISAPRDRDFFLYEFRLRGKPALSATQGERTRAPLEKSHATRLGGKSPRSLSQDSAEVYRRGEEIFCKPQWLLSPQTDSQPQQNQAWLIISTNNFLSSELENNFLTNKSSCHIASLEKNADKFLQQAKGFTINPLNIRHFDKLFESLKSTTALDGIIYIPDCEEKVIPPITELNEDNFSSCHTLLLLLQSIIKNRIDSQLLVITQGLSGQNIENSALIQSPIVGLAKTINFEQPQLRCRIIDILGNIKNRKAVSRIYHEIYRPDQENYVSLQGDDRYIFRITHYNAPNDKRLMLSPHKTYLITGGTGGIGIELTKYLFKNGVRYFVLLSRNQPTSEIKSTLDKLIHDGAEIKLYNVDMVSYSKLQAILTTIKKTMPALAGILHCAGVNNQTAIQYQSWNDFMATFASKVFGSWHLHILTKDISLDFFVLFSSIASLFGARQTSAYAAANAFMDGLANHRNNLGLCGLSINWGPWNKVGMITETLRDNMNNHLPGFIEPDTGVVAFHKALSTTATQLGIIAQDYPQLFFATAPQSIPSYLKLLFNHEPAATPAEHSTHAFYHSFNQALEAEKLPLLKNSAPRDRDFFLYEFRLRGKPALTATQGERTHAPLEKPHATRLGGKPPRFLSLKDMIAAQLRTVLHISTIQPLDYQRGFFQYGLDSLSAVEFVKQLKIQLPNQIRLTTAIIFNYPNINQLADYFYNELSKNSASSKPKKTDSTQKSNNDSIAVISMNCRFPNNIDSPEKFWEFLISGKSSIAKIPEYRIKLSSHASNTEVVENYYGSFLQAIEYFDADFFNISPREAASMDPQQRILLETVWHCIEQSGNPIAHFRDNKTGVFIGVSNNDYAILQTRDSTQHTALKQFATSSTLNMLPGRVSYVFGLSGPSVAIDTACSSSLTALHTACQSLKQGDCEAAIVGGINLILDLNSYTILNDSNMLANDGRCKVFDIGANGYVRGEGCGVVILKSLTKALANGDNILGVIRGSAINQDGASTGLTAPNGTAQANLITEALHNANVTADEVSYIEAHGTGTALGDLVETTALNAVFAGRKSAAQANPLIVGAVKTNMGHLESAAGIVSLIKVLLAIKHKTIPKNLNLNTLNPDIDTTTIPIIFPKQTTTWQPENNMRIAGISAFGFSGTNVHIIVEEPRSISAAKNGGFYHAKASSSVALPRYPFQRRSYWYSKLDSPTPSKKHNPLLGKRLSIATSDQIIYQSTINLSSLAFIKDHQLFATPVLAGACYLSAIISAYFELTGKKAGAFYDIDFIKPLQITNTDDIKLQTFITPETSSSFHFKVYSSNNDSLADNRWQLHIKGRVSQPDKNDAHANINVGKYRSDARNILNGDDYYHALSKLGLSISNHHAWINKIHLLTSKLLVEFRDPKPSEKLDNTLYPGFIDGLFHIFGIPLHLKHDNRLLIPYTLNNFYFDLHNGFPKYGLYDLNNNELQLLTAQGLSTGLLHGLALKEINNQQLNRLLDLNPTKNDLYKVNWIESELVTSAEITATTWLIFCNNESLIKYLHQLFSKRKDVYYVVHSGATFQKHTDKCFTINVSKPSDYSKLFSCIPEVSIIIHAYTLSQSAPPETICANDILAKQAIGLKNCFHILQQLLAANLNSPINFWLLTSNLYCLPSDTSINLAHTGLTGFQNTVISEDYSINVASIDFCHTMKQDTIYNLIAREIFHVANSFEPRIAYRNARRMIARIEEYPSSYLDANRMLTLSIDPNSTYLITGGLGGIGRALIDWLIELGAKNIALISRHPASKSLAQHLDAYQNKDVKVVIFKLDISDEKAVKHFFSTYQDSLPTLRGIFHLAGSMKDAALFNQSWDNFEAVFAAKVIGTSHLHNMTQHLALDFFVMFSSLSAILGSPGQSNYAAANAFLDGMAHFRKLQNYPGISINWGLWETSRISNQLSNLDKYQNKGLQPISTQSGMQLLKKAMLLDIPNVSIVKAKSTEHLNSLYLQEIFVHKRSASKVLTLANAKDQLEFLQQLLIGKIASILHLDRKLISAEKSLIAYGMDSIMAIELKTFFDAEFNIITSVNLLFDNRSIAEIAQQLLSLILTKNPGTIDPAAKLQTHNDFLSTYTLPLNIDQFQMYFLHKLNPAKAITNIGMAFTLTGELNIENLNRAFINVIKQQPILRTTLSAENTTVALLLHNSIASENLKIEILNNISDLSNSEIFSLLESKIYQPFNVSYAPLIRCCLFPMSPDKALLLVAMPHFLADAQSLFIFINELINFYNKLANNEPITLIPHDENFAAITAQQINYIEQYNDAAKFQLKHNTYYTLNLPKHISRPQNKADNRFETLHSIVPTDIHHGLQKLCRSTEVTLFTLTLSVFQLVLSKFASDQGKFTILVPMTLRHNSHMQNLMNYFIKTIAFTCDIDYQLNFKSLLHDTKNTINNIHRTIDSHDRHSNTINLSDSAYQVAFVLHNFTKPITKLEHINAKVFYGHSGQPPYMLVLECFLVDDSLNVYCKYNAGLLDKNLIASILQSYQFALKTIVNNAGDIALNEFKLLNHQTTYAMLKRHKNTSFELANTLTIQNEFNTQVNLNPNKIAVCYQKKTLTYKHLSHYANRCANLICQKYAPCATHDTIIAIYIERGLEMVIATMGILMSGAAYLPLDPLLPENRLQMILNESKVKIIVTTKGLLNKFANHDNSLSFVCMDDVMNPHCTIPETQPISSPQKNSLAYVIYTSGSTGIPKGIMVEHRSVLNLIASMKKLLNFNSNEIVLNFFSLAFDVSVFEIFIALLTGSQLHIVDHALAADTENLAKYIATTNITLLTLPTSILNLFKPKQLSSLKYLLTGGETGLNFNANELTNQTQFIHAYGPTEATVFCSINLQFKNSEPTNIGNPIHNMTAYVLDNFLNLVPDGVIGELYFSGTGLARGYLHDSQLSKQAFINNPYFDASDDKPSSAMLYRTGDLAYWKNGELIYVGRKDNQVKVSGYRIELEEVEAAINQYPDIKHSVVIKRAVAHSSQLVAYYVQHLDTLDITPCQLKNFLRQKLPHYAIPNFFIRLSELPRLSSGKVSRKNLPDPEANFMLTDQPIDLPKSQTQSLLIDAWKKVLKLNTVSIDSNFFESGGNSILVIQLQSEIKSIFSKNIDLIKLFHYPTIRSFTNYLQQSEDNFIIPKQSQSRSAQRKRALQKKYTDRSKDSIHEHE